MVAIPERFRETEINRNQLIDVWSFHSKVPLNSLKQDFIVSHSKAYKNKLNIILIVVAQINKNK